MNEDKNIVDFAARAALERGRREGYALAELDGETLKSIFDAAYVDCAVDEDGNCIVQDDLTVGVGAEPARDLFKLFSYFSTSGTREQALEFCNRFNLQLVVVRAQVRDEPDSGGQWPVLFDHDRWCFDEERLDPKGLVRSVRLFQQIVRYGIARFDEDGIFQ